MNKIIISAGVIGIITAGAVGIGSLNASALNGGGAHSANGQGAGYQASLKSRADVLGMSVEDLQKALETKTMSQVAIDQGIDENTFRTKMTEAAQKRWEANGLSADEIAQRIADREARQAENSTTHEFGSGEGSGNRGYGRNHRQ